MAKQESDTNKRRISVSVDTRAKKKRETRARPLGQLKSGGATRQSERESREQDGWQAGRKEGRQHRAGFLYNHASPERSRDHESRSRLGNFDIL